MIQKFLSQVYLYVTYFLAPPYCLYCRKPILERTAFCASCAALVIPIVPFDFYLGKQKVVRVFAVSAYKEPLRSLILAKHFGNETYIRYLADFIANSSNIKHLDFDCIVYIPLHWTRYASRGFNQAQIIAQKLQEVTGKPVYDCLIRSKKTQFQARLSLQEREENVSNVFTVDEKYAQQLAGKKILIVDDLFTTGSTIKAVSLELFRYHPAQIDVFVACRVTQG